MEELTPFIERYYPAWVRFSRYICSRYHIPREADDVLGDAMLMLCNKSFDVLHDLLRHELAGECKLNNLVYRMIKIRAYGMLYMGRHTTLNLDSLLFRLTQDDDDAQSFTDEMRDATAQLREDDFIDPHEAHKIGPIIGGVYQYIDRKYVSYRAEIKKGIGRGIRKRFTTRHAAFEFLMQMAATQ